MCTAHMHVDKRHRRDLLGEDGPVGCAKQLTKQLVLSERTEQADNGRHNDCEVCYLCLLQNNIKTNTLCCLAQIGTNLSSNKSRAREKNT